MVSPPSSKEGSYHAQIDFRWEHPPRRRRGLGGSLKLTTRKSISCGMIISPPAEEYFGERNVSCWDFESNCYFSPFLLSYCYEWFLKQKPTKGCISHRLHQPQAKSVKAASATGCISHRLHQPQPSWRQCSCSLCTAKYFEYLDGVAPDDLNSRDEKPLVSSWRRGRAIAREIEQERQEWKEWLEDNKAWAARVRANLERNRLQKKGCISQEPGESTASVVASATWPHSD